MICNFRLLICSTILIACLGCGDDESAPEDETDPFAGVELPISVPAELDLQARWRIELDEWSTRTGATYRLHEYDGEPPDDTAALVLLPITETAGREFAPIPPELQSPENLHYVDLFAGLRGGPATFGGKPALLPISSPVLVYFYRRDLFDAAGLQPPETWQDHLRVLTELQARKLAAVEPWSEEFRATMFLARAVAYARHPHHFSLFFDVETGAPLIDSPGFVRALNETKEQLQLMRQSADVFALSPDDCRNMLLNGEAAAAVTVETNAAAIDVERPPAAIVGCVRLPGHPTAYNRSTGEWETPPDNGINRCTLTAFAGMCVGVSAGASELQQRAGWAFLSQIAVDTGKLTQAFPAHVLSMCRESQLSRPDAWISEGFTAGESSQITAAVAASLRDSRLAAELPVVGRRRFRDALTAGLGRCLNDEATAEEALQEVAGEWRSIRDELGAEIVLNSYRRSIGLSVRRRP